ncbi:MAG: hypothetical protein SGPRY_014395, partial [Prymnesium sp.]
MVSKCQLRDNAPAALCLFCCHRRHNKGIRHRANAHCHLAAASQGSSVTASLIRSPSLTRCPPFVLAYSPSNPIYITCTLSHGCSPALPAAGVPHSSLSPSILRLCIFLSFSLRVRHAPLTPNFQCLPSVQVLESRERSPTSSLVPRVIEHFLYAPRNVPPEAELTSLALGVDELPHLSTAEALPAEAWVALLREFIIERPCVAVVGKPSAELAASLAAGVTERLAATRQALGEEGLAQAASRLDAA